MRKAGLLPRGLAAALLLGIAAAWIAWPAAVREVSAHPAATPPSHTFSVADGQFLLDGQPFALRIGEMHFQRIPRALWRDRLRMARAMGLNAVGTYLFWNALEPAPGRYDFSGNNDVAEFVREAQAVGLWVLLRPGPYACAEWDFGGLPSWLLRTPGMRIRTADPRFMAAARDYLRHVGAQLAPLQITHGGPIVLTQVENEYGSFGHDKRYLEKLRQALRAAGFDGLLYTADGGDVPHLTAGSLPGVLMGANIDGNPAAAFAAVRQLRPGQPFLISEYYPGWFDHWGEAHHRRPTGPVLADVAWFLTHGASFSLYMFHGGTNFGFMNGANYSDSAPYQPTTTSYDYDAPLDEAGRPTPKYLALRELIARHLPLGERLPAVPAAPRPITFPPLELNESASLWSLLGKRVVAARPLTFEALGQAYGFVLYRTVPRRRGTGVLDIDEPRDYALVYQDGRLLGTLDRRLGQKTLRVSIEAGKPLDILVENMGRINYGDRMGDGFAGITHRVTVDGVELRGWRMYRLPLDDLSALHFSHGKTAGPAFYRGTLLLDEPGDTFLDLRGFTKGHAWVNGHHLGRFWHIGPQQTLYVPGVWLRRGRNEIVVLDEEPGAEHRVQGVSEPIYATPGPR